MREETNRIDESHRKELLKFLLVKTAAVRQGIKPAELLRVRHCYAGVNSEGLRVCLYRSDIYGILGLDYVELKVEAASSLVLFYNPSVLAATLGEGRSRRWLSRLGYPAAGALRGLLGELRRRCEGKGMPHEVGVFIGYPLKDVAGFMRRIPATPVHHGSWRVYGGARESLERMRLYASAEDEARVALQSAQEFIDAGIPAEDARFVMPNAAASSLVTSLNLRELIHLANLRLCTRAQYEIRTMVKMMCDELIKEEPWLKPYLIPKCERLGFCDEDKSCGRKPKLGE